MFQKSSHPPKTFFGILSLRLCRFAYFANLLAIHIHIIHQFLLIYLNISSNGVNFSTSRPTRRFYLVKFSVFTRNMKINVKNFHRSLTTVYSLRRSSVVSKHFCFSRRTLYSKLVACRWSPKCKRWLG